MAEAELRILARQEQMEFVTTPSLRSCDPRDR